MSPRLASWAGLALLTSACVGPSEAEEPLVSRAGIGFYQRWLGPQWAYHCDMEPSCSEYGRQAIDRYGLLPGALMTADRLMRDHGNARHQYAQDAHGHPLDPPEDNALFAPRRAEGKGGFDEERARQEEQRASEARPGPPEEWLALAEELLDRGRPTEAGVEFRRILRLAPSSPQARAARRGLIVSLGLQERYTEAEVELDRVAPDERDELRAWLRYRAGELEQAVDLLAENRAEDRAERRALRGALALEADRVEEARRAFDSLDAEAAARLGARADAWEELPHRSPWAAGLMSALLPGSGQFYAGRRADGLVAFLTNGILIGATAAAIHNEEPVTAGVVGFVALGFWAGNIHGGANAAHHHDREVRRGFLRELRGELRQHGVGWGLSPTRGGGALGLYLRF